MQNLNVRLQLGDKVVARIYPHPVTAYIVAIEGEVAMLNWPDETGCLLTVYTHLLTKVPEVRPAGHYH